jgi:histidinol-phosphate aminotransferase
MINIKNLVRPNIIRLKPYSSARDEFSGLEGVFLDANENPYGTLNRYPDPYQKELKKKLIVLKSIALENIFIGNGSDEVIDLAFRIFCIPGLDKALTFSPTYGMYKVSAAINDIELIKLPLTNTFQIDLEHLKPFLSDTSIKLIFICSPNNPTGNLMNKNDVVFILLNFNGIVILDEAYIDFAEEESLINLTAQYNNLIVSQTFSKARGLAAARVGLAYACEEIISLYNRVKPPYNVSVLNQQAAIDALNNQYDFQGNISKLLKERELLKNELLKLDVVQKIYPSDANFLLVEVANADEIYCALVKQGVISRNRNKQVANCIRISIGTADENQILITAFKKIQ